jgi:hypothetical protein
VTVSMSLVGQKGPPTFTTATEELASIAAANEGNRQHAADVEDEATFLLRFSVEAQRDLLWWDHKSLDQRQSI